MKRLLPSLLSAALLCALLPPPAIEGRERSHAIQRISANTERRKAARLRSMERRAPQPPLIPARSSSSSAPLLPVSDQPIFAFHWKGSTDLAGETQLPLPAPHPVVILDGRKTILPQSSAATRLANLYHIVLVDDEEPWDADHATLLLEMLRRLPDSPFKNTGVPAWKITLTNQPLINDVDVTSPPGSGVLEARFSKAAFVRSNPTLQPNAEGNTDRVFYSNRLFRAVLSAFYNNQQLLEETIKRRYGYRVGGGTPVDEFQDFSIEELQFLASVLEDLPEGFRNIPGLRMITRRRQGLTNPVYPTAPAIAWLESGELEFTDRAFISGNTQYIQRLVAHEMAHFLWDKVLSKETREQFQALSGWVKRKQDTWTHGTTTNFVSDYATVDPLEDFAETLSYFIYNPDLVRAVAPLKYNFVRTTLDGYEYVVLVEKRFTFQVFNLEPKTTFPGKIVGIDIEVSKTAGGDNRVRATLHLSPAYGDGAEQAFSRIVSPVGTYVDVYFLPLHGNKHLLQADFSIPRDAANGYWTPELITVRDKADNRRYEGQQHFGWLLSIQNNDEDTEAPIADPERITLTTSRESDGGTAVRVMVPVNDAHPQGLGGYAVLTETESRQSEGVYATYDAEGGQLIFLFIIRPFRASGTWTFREFTVSDNAGNRRRYDLKKRERSVNIHTSKPDTAKPELDLEAIAIIALPTRPQAPNGETDVSISYAARDDISGLGWVSYTLLKPNGDSLFDYHYHENFHTPAFIGDPTAWKPYTIQLRLPPGSIPGTWILREITLQDKAGNILSTNFVEIGIVKKFAVEGEK